MILIQISDLHITDPGEPVDRLARTTERLAIAVARINAMQPRPDGVIVTGDLVNECRTSAYARMRPPLVPLLVPIWLMVGNHDARDDLRLVCSTDDVGYDERRHDAEDHDHHHDDDHAQSGSVHYH